MGTRGYSDREVSEHVERGQHRRLDARGSDPRWRLVRDEWSDSLGGGTWQEVQEQEDAA